MVRHAMARMLLQCQGSRAVVRLVYYLEKSRPDTTKATRVSNSVI